MPTMTDDTIAITNEQFDQLQALYNQDVANSETFDNNLYIQYYQLKESWGSNVGAMGVNIREGTGALGVFVKEYFKGVMGETVTNQVFDTTLDRKFIEEDLNKMIENKSIDGYYRLLSTEEFVKNEIDMMDDFPKLSSCFLAFY